MSKKKQDESPAHKKGLQIGGLAARTKQMIADLTPKEREILAKRMGALPDELKP